MLVSELDGIDNHGYGDILSTTLIWNKDVSELSDIKLLTTYALLKNRKGHYTANRAIKHVIQQVRRAQFFGYIDDDNELKFEPNAGILTLNDFNTHMEKLGIIEARMFLFALGSGLDLTDLSTITWDQARRLDRHKKLNPVASEIIRTSVRYFKTNLLFWQTGKKGQAIPCLDIDHIVSQVTGRKWSDYVKAYFNMAGRPF